MKSHICWCVIDYTFMVIDYQWLFSKNSFPKVIFLQVTCFWRFFQKSYLFKWLVLKELPRVTSFDLSHQETINMWPWHETFIHLNHLFQINLSIFSFMSFNRFFLIHLLFIFLKVFCSKISLSRKVLCSKTCAIHLFHYLLPLPKKIRQGLTAWILFVSLFSLFQKNKGLTA